MQNETAERIKDVIAVDQIAEFDVVELPGRTLWGPRVKYPVPSGAKTVDGAWLRAAEELRLA